MIVRVEGEQPASMAAWVRHLAVELAPPSIALQYRQEAAQAKSCRRAANRCVALRPPCACRTGGEDVPLDYARCKEVLAKLSETAEKGFLGSYKGAAGEWDKIVRAYEYNCELEGAKSNPQQGPAVGHAEMGVAAGQQRSALQPKAASVGARLCTSPWSPLTNQGGAAL